jgi:hypothetical protein
MDIYAKNLNLEAMITKMKEKSRLDGIEITWLKREVNKRDKLIA